MEFKKFSAGEKGYGTGLKPTFKQLPNCCFNDREFDDELHEIVVTGGGIT